MPELIANMKKVTITLEESITGDNTAWLETEIFVDYPVSSVTGVFGAADGSGVNFWTAFEGNSHDGLRLTLSAEAATAAGGASSAVWVTYLSADHLEVTGALLGPNIYRAAIAVAQPVNLIGSGDSFTEVGLAFIGADISANEMPLDPRSDGPVAIRGITVVTDGTDLSIGIYSAAVDNYANLLWVVPNVDTRVSEQVFFAAPASPVYIGVLDTAADATPANTFIKLWGYHNP